METPDTNAVCHLGPHHHFLKWNLGWPCTSPHPHRPHNQQSCDAQETWGGGASVENPHFQRVHYCELLRTELLSRVPCGRFPPIDEDLAVMRAHCGALELSPRAVLEAGLQLNVLEALQQRVGGSPGVRAEVAHAMPVLWCG